jgi:hypothetical protein
MSAVPTGVFLSCLRAAWRDGWLALARPNIISV